MTDTDITDLDQRAAARVKAAEERYKSLDSHMFVELSGRMPHKSLRPATDAAVGLVRRELESVYVGYLAAKEEHDPLVQRVRDLEYEREQILNCVRIIRDGHPADSKLWRALDDILAVACAVERDGSGEQ